MIRTLKRHAGVAALALALLALVLSWTGAADAARKKFTGAGSTKPRPYGLLRLSKQAKFPAKAIPKVRAARRC